MGRHGKRSIIGFASAALVAALSARGAFAAEDPVYPELPNFHRVDDGLFLTTATPDRVVGTYVDPATKLELAFDAARSGDMLALHLATKAGVSLVDIDTVGDVYRFSYLGSDKPYVGVMAQEVEAVMPGAVTRGGDGYLRVHYDRLGLKFLTYKDWLAAGAQIPLRVRM